MVGKQPRRPGRKPVYDYEKFGITAPAKSGYSSTLSVRLPVYAIHKLDSMVARGLYPNRSRAVHDLIMFSDEDLRREIARLKEEIEELKGEIQLRDQKIARLERETADALEKAREWEEKYRELEAKLAGLASGVVDDSMEVVGMKAEDLISELERVDLVELAREYYRLREALHKWDGYFVFLGEERMKRKDAEKRVEELRRRINQVLDLRGIPRAEAWKRINNGKFEGLDKLAKG
ncbi:hypothetical protein [Thermococcus sp.]|uniref:hypothetical protein n=1 Tax=Thermococcus sp. TaxID=35749 RepID=UPI0025CFA838|nr:hypothetical protein [Thermococcus sp.]